DRPPRCHWCRYLWIDRGPKAFDGMACNDSLFLPLRIVRCRETSERGGGGWLSLFFVFCFLHTVPKKGQHAIHSTPTWRCFRRHRDVLKLHRCICFIVYFITLGLLRSSLRFGGGVSRRAEAWRAEGSSHSNGTGTGG
ncbi:unnamed protein product, partial [Laminaria digitata]